MESPRLCKFTLHVKRKVGMSEDEFHEHWSKVHVPIVNNWLARHGVTRYVQYHTPSKFQLLLQNSLQGKRTLDYDGIVEMTMPSIECLQEAFKDSYYIEVVQPDEKQFIDGENSLATLGWEETYISDGKCIE